MSESIRESLEAAGAALAEAPATEAPAVEVDATPAPEAAEATSTEAAPVERADGRDDKGRFAPKSTAGETPSPGQAAPTGSPTKAEGAASSTPAPKAAETIQTPAPKPGEPDTTHAPQSWPIGARTAWEKVPPEVRGIIHRRELETAQTLSRSAPDRQLAAEVRQLVSPIAKAIEQRGTTPQRLIAEYVNFDRELTSRDPATQAMALARVIKGYGVPIEALADALDGKLTQPQRQPSIDELREEARREARQEWQQQQQQYEYKNHAQKVQEFAKGADPILFNDEVRHDMAALIDAAAARGVELSLQEAFDRAVMANPEARAIVQQREQAKRAATQQQATQRSAAAASSVKSRPASPVGGESRGNSIRADLEAAAAAISGRT